MKTRDIKVGQKYNIHFTNKKYSKDTHYIGVGTFRSVESSILDNRNQVLIFDLPDGETGYFSPSDVISRSRHAESKYRLTQTYPEVLEAYSEWVEWVTVKLTKHGKFSSAKVDPFISFVVGYNMARNKAIKS